MDAADMAWAPQEKTLESSIAKIVSTQQSKGSSSCNECGDLIPLARREAAPWARHCISCQEELELQGRHMRRF